MNRWLPALWAETLKARRSRVSLLTVIGFALFPLVSGLFMIILKDPTAAQAMGLISMKAQLVAGTADWPTFFDMLLQSTAMAGFILFAFIVAWVFGREYSDRTAKELLALPTPRGVIVGAKFVLTTLWALGLTLLLFVIGLGVGAAVNVPGWSPELAWSSFWSLMTIAVLNLMLMPFVALFASAGRGYLPPLGWAVFSFILAQIISVLGWGDWFPWSVPVLLSGMFGPQGTEQIDIHSYILSLMALIAGIAATLASWQSTDQVR
jgi:ABC-2 type transport system permease protein